MRLDLAALQEDLRRLGITVVAAALLTVLLADASLAAFAGIVLGAALISIGILRKRS